MPAWHGTKSVLYNNCVEFVADRGDESQKEINAISWQDNNAAVELPDQLYPS
jgi:hypothetical protein